MAKLWAVFKVVFLERMAYRTNFFLQILSGILSSLIVIFLWMAVYRSAGRGSIGGFSLGEMITYLLGSGLINTFILTTAENPETSQNIQDGTLSFLFLQPVSPYGIWFMRDLGGKTFNLLLGMAGYGVIFLFFREYLVPGFSAQSMMPFGAAVLTGSILQFLFFEALSLLSFWIENTYGIRFTMRVVMEVLGGAIIPLSLLPDFLRIIAACLPFQYLVYFPMEIYLGKISGTGILLEFLKEGGWIAGLMLTNWTIWRKGVRRYVAMGD